MLLVRESVSLGDKTECSGFPSFPCLRVKNPGMEKQQRLRKVPNAQAVTYSGA